MAFIEYASEDGIPAADRVADPDNIIQIHRIHPPVMRQHYALYRQLMHGPGPLSRRERELLAVRVSALNHCHY
jgi:alkylhydroperoxidase family enzyme